MIKMLRIDDRLLHGQVVFMWTKQLHIKGIIVANDELVTDPIQSLSLIHIFFNDGRLLCDPKRNQGEYHYHRDLCYRIVRYFYRSVVRQIIY